MTNITRGNDQRALTPFVNEKDHKVTHGIRLPGRAIKVFAL
ncbi:MAG: hypothetical protein QOG71_3430 [Pyrinomonadaceae bacterium]|nr:hypothetical protein [Pyrinomonadaceae bacterium]